VPAPGVFRSILTELRSDVAAIKTRDPAARDVGTLEILMAWPGLHALLAHRVAHALWQTEVPLLPRLIALVSRAMTGIEIHPAAQIGERFVVDHGMGVVIGETAEIGDDVTLYQGVTLGGTGFATGKRHPTVQDNVTIGSGAKLLGPITVGHGAKIGANTVVIHDVPPNSTVVGNPGHPVRVEGRRPEGPDADWIHLPDPVAEAIRGLSSRIASVEASVEEHESEPPEPDGRPTTIGTDPRRPERRGPADADGHADGRTNPAVGPNPAGG
jgi:serine O-acetyltransferase